jgi:hypothetical protein
MSPEVGQAPRKTSVIAIDFSPERNRRNYEETI